MDKTFHFISGLPRSGSTLLCNILCQNPRFHATSSSGVLNIITGIRNSWDDVAELKATPNEKAKLNVMRGILDNFYLDIEKPVVFDKSRGWVAIIGLLEKLLDRNVKVLVTVRDVRDILASFEKIWERDSKTIQIPQEKENPIAFQTMQGRVNVWLADTQPVGIALNKIKDAIKRGYSDRLCLIDFDDLTSEPAVTMKKIYEFLGEPYFEHDFNNVEQVTKEDDSVHGFTDLHTIRSKVEPMRPQWPTVLGKDFEHFSSLNFWKK